MGESAPEAMNNRTPGDYLGNDMPFLITGVKSKV